jgi:glyoxylase-like metal-dependent hydrolase (beta-lactamase superfamily II)
MAVMARWCGVLCVGDYLSNVEIPMVEAGLGDYRATLARLAPLVEAAETIVPGHGSPHGRDVALRILDEDVDYLDALERGEERPKLPGGRDTSEQRRIHAENVERLR